MTKIDDGGPAFPLELQKQQGLGIHTTTYFGMSLRDWFAGQALPAAFAKVGVGGETQQELTAALAYSYADAMLKESRKGAAQ